MSDSQGSSLVQQFFRACLLILGGILAICFAVELLAQIWGWLLLIAGVAVLGFVGFVSYRWWRDRIR